MPVGMRGPEDHAVEQAGCQVVLGIVTAEEQVADRIGLVLHDALPSVMHKSSTHRKIRCVDGELSR